MALKKIAFLGLGTMGRGMARTLLKKGFKLTVWNRTPKAAKAFARRGAKAADTIEEACAGADVVMYSLSNDRAVEDVVFGEKGVLWSAQAGQLVIDASTINPKLSRREARAFEEKGVAFLDAPVFGSKNEAASGGLWVIVGGKESTFKKARPVLKAISETVNYMGASGAGTSMKLVGNLIVAMQLEAVGEAMVLATKAGLEPSEVLKVVKVTDFRSPIIEGVGQTLIERNFEPMFALKHLLKDANLISDFASELNSPAPALAIIRENIRTAVNQGWGEENASAMIKALELAGKTTVKD